MSSSASLLVGELRPAASRPEEPGADNDGGLQRGRANGRCCAAPAQGQREAQRDEYGQQNASGLHSTGRILLNLWRIVRGEVKLNMYSFEACCAAVLRRRVPHVPPAQLAAWFAGGACAVLGRELFGAWSDGTCP